MDILTNLYPQSFHVNNMKINRFFYILVLLLFISCHSRENKEVPECSLQHEVFEEESLTLGNIRMMALVSDSMLVLVNKQSDILFQVVDLKNKNLMDFGNRGQGPDDFLLPTSLKGYSDNHFSLWDINRKRYSSVVFSLETSSVSFDHHFTSDDSFLHYEILPITGNHFVSSGIYENYRLLVLDEMGCIMKGVGNIPARDVREENISGNIRSEVYQGKMAVSPSGKKVVQALLRSDIISFYNVTSDGELQLASENIGSYPEYSYETGAMELTAPIHHIDVSATEKYVYVLYSGRNYKKYKDKSFLSNRIDVYDWNGRLIKRLNLDVDIKLMCVSEDDKTIYAIAYLPDPVLVLFE